MRKSIYTLLITLSFAIMSMAQATITSLSPTTAIIGGTVEINGTGFNATPANNIVYFAGIKATVTAATTTKLTVTVPNCPSVADIKVLTGGLVSSSSITFKAKQNSAGSLTLGWGSDMFKSETSVNLTGGGGTHMEAVDIDNDGDLDFLIPADDHIELMTNPGASPGSSPAFSLGDMTISTINYTESNRAIDIKTADLDNDGDIDIIIGLKDVNKAEILTNNGSGSYTSAGVLTFSNLGNDDTFLAIADVNNDGWLDIGATTFNTYAGSGGVLFEIFTQSDVTPLSFSSYYTLSGVSSNSWSSKISFIDFDDDGYQDIIYAARSNGTYYVKGSAAGFSSTLNTINSSVSSVTYGDPYSVDYNNDGKLDVIISSQSDQRVMQESGGGLTETVINKHSRFGHFFDIDDDGDMDIIGSDYFYNSGSENIAGIYQNSTNLSSFIAYSGESQLIDMNEDGYLDIVFVERYGSKMYYQEFKGVGALPVELTEFSARQNNETVSLNWQTASELNNKQFEVERSKDGNNWEVIDIVEGRGTITHYQNYHSIDEKPIAGKSYYRLKQVDFDGAFEYSDIKSVDFRSNIQNDQLKFFPNPASSTIYISKNKIELDQLVLINMQGQVVNENITMEKTGENGIRIDINNLSRGVYFIRYKNEGKPVIIGL
ncbi:MAG: FG-GAP-like repeat-containing protein [Saprospiraceae bacterium]